MFREVWETHHKFICKKYRVKFNMMREKITNITLLWSLLKTYLHTHIYLKFTYRNVKFYEY